MTDAALIAIITGSFVLLGTAIGVFAGAIIQWIKEQHENKRKVKELVIRAAIEDWSKTFAVYSKVQGAKTMPLDSYILHYISMTKFLLEKDLNVEELKDFLEKSEEIMEVYRAHSEKLERKFDKSGT